MKTSKKSNKPVRVKNLQPKKTIKAGVQKVREAGRRIVRSPFGGQDLGE